MNHKILVSYTSDVSDAVEILVEALLSLNFDVIFYTDEKKRGWHSSSSWIAEFRRHAEETEIFLQVIGNGLGSEMQMTDGTTLPSIPAEFEIYRQVNKKRGGQPVFLGFYFILPNQEAATEVDQFIKNIGANREKFFKVSKIRNLLSSAIRFVQGAVNSNMNVVKGVLIPGSECSNILSEVIAHIQSKKTFPQKYLYATLRGACLWKWLASTASGSAIAKVYATSPFRNSDTKIYKAIAKVAQNAAISGANQEETILGILVLGCGDGKREAELCGRFLDEGVAARLRVVLVDVSSELIETAVREFETWRDRCDVHFAIIDFEKMSALQELRSRFFTNIPVLSLLLGNTLGNVDEEQMLSEIVRSLHPNDYLLAEMLLCDEKEAESQSLKEYNVGEDKRFEFITTPLLLLGIEPKRQNLYRLVAGDGKGKIIQTFQYRFNDRETELTVRDKVSEALVHIKQNSRINLLEIKAVTYDLLGRIGKNAGLSDPVVISYEYQIPNQRPLSMGYLIGRVNSN